MKKNIKKVSASFVTAGVQDKVCPLNWLAEFYREFPGKLVMLDSKLLSFLLNESHVDEIALKEVDAYHQRLDLVWNATEKYPETRVTIDSLGRDKIKQTKQEFVVNSDRNHYVITDLQADDILVQGMKYADNLYDGQILFLTEEKSQEKSFE